MSEPGGGGGEDGSAGLEVSAVQNVADVSVLQKHLRKLVPLLLEDGGEAPAALEAALEEKSALEQMRKFLSDPQVHTVLVERSTLKGAGPGPGGRGRGLGDGTPGRRDAGTGAASALQTPCGMGPRGRRARPAPHPLPGGSPGGASFRVAGNEERVPPSCRHARQWDRFVCSGLKMAELGGDSVSRAERGRRPRPGLQCHMSFSVSICGRAGPSSRGMCQGQTRGAVRSLGVGVGADGSPGRLPSVLALPCADPDAEAQGGTGPTGAASRASPFQVVVRSQVCLLVLTASLPSGCISLSVCRRQALRR